MTTKVSEAQRYFAPDYRPLALTLTGFKGIRSELGREAVTLDLEALAGDATRVAIAGTNGRGKTILLENLPPVMLISGCQHCVSATPVTGQFRIKIIRGAMSPTAATATLIKPLPVRV